MKLNKFSIIIRTYNEEKKIRDVLDAIYNQEYKNYEVIIVDSESTDNTLNICSEYDLKIITIKKSDFDYSYASNIGAEHSSGDILCYISGHSVPVRKDYLELANKHFQDDIVGGVYGEVIAHNDASFTEKIFNNIGYLKSKREGIITEYDIHPGILSCSNAFIRRSLWEKYKFKRELGKGGEDIELAYRIIQEGKCIIKDPDILVKHSHGNGIFKFVKEFKNWRTMYEDVTKYICRN